jgi:hypothetical protein
MDMVSRSSLIAGVVLAMWVQPGPRAVAQPPVDDDDKAAEWKGSLDWSSEQRVPAGTQYFSGHLDLTLDEDDGGGLKGTLAGSQTQKLDLTTCPSVAVSPGNLTAHLTGKVVRQQVTIDVADPTYAPPTMSPCPTGGPPGTGGAIFKWPHFDEALRSLTPVDQYNYEFDREWTVPQRYPFTVHYTVKLQRSKLVPRFTDE